MYEENHELLQNNVEVTFTNINTRTDWTEMPGGYYAKKRRVFVV